MKPREEIIQQINNMPRPFNAKSAEKVVWLALYEHLHALDVNDVKDVTPSEMLLLTNAIVSAASIVEGRVEGQVYFMRRVDETQAPEAQEEQAQVEERAQAPAAPPVIATGGPTLAETPPAKRKAKTKKSQP